MFRAFFQISGDIFKRAANSAILLNRQQRMKKCGRSQHTIHTQERQTVKNTTKQKAKNEKKSRT